MRPILRLSAYVALFLMTGVCCAWTQTSAATYYPLTVGNTWKYEVHELGKRRSFVVWRVTKRSHSKDGAVYQIWPTPMENDDDAQTVIVKKDQVREFESGTLLVGNGLKIGEHWELSVKGRVVRQLRVVSSEKPCKAAGYEYRDCITISDTDERLQLLTITCYAKGVGPVWFKYYDSKTTPTSQAESVVELISFRVNTDDKGTDSESHADHPKSQ
jgi:hypothetical protein